MTSEQAEFVLTNLLDAILTGSVLEWSLKYMIAGDPIPTAWRACGNDRPMRSLAWLCKRADSESAYRLLSCRELCYVDSCADCVSAILEKIPSLTFEDALRAMEGRRG